MAKIKISPEEPEQPKKENLIPVQAVIGFTDGNLAGFFAEYSYSVTWAAGERRKIPYWLIERCKNSGAELEMLAK